MNKLSSIYNYKCPRCRQGDLFVKPFNVKAPLDMFDKCSHCAQKIEPEPGYYFGAMFISYGMTVWTILGIVGFCMMVLGWSIEVAFSLVILFTIITFFWVARISRSIYIHLDIKYNKELGQQIDSR